ncbi:MAG: hypothetical protein U5K27_01515 [Desulfotignum sp.]|nr:hypothetical protein [Desulfotignum sp.]
MISKTLNVYARLIPKHDQKRFEIEVKTGAGNEEMKAAEQGTVQNGQLVYELDGKGTAPRFARCGGITRMKTAIPATGSGSGKNTISSRVPMISFRKGYTAFSGSQKNRWRNPGRKHTLRL